tara:strand:+ start:365 stop:655 length:291 start_codon:yes stop_codon:yes gene_type:complete
MDSLSSIKHNKNLLRVAAEIAGKGNTEGNNDVDEIEEIKPATPEAPVTEETSAVEEFTKLVLEELRILEENSDVELQDEQLDSAIKNIIDNIVDNS